MIHRFIHACMLYNLSPHSPDPTWKKRKYSMPATAAEEATTTTAAAAAAATTTTTKYTQLIEVDRVSYF